MRNSDLYPPNRAAWPGRTRRLQRLTLVVPAGAAMLLLAGIDAGTPTAPQIATGAGVNPTTLEINRGECVTLFLEAAADATCGDVRIVHPLPTMQSLNRTFTPVLIYSSEAAEPGVNVAVNVTLPAGATVPDSVTAALSIAGGPAQVRSWTGSHWTAGQTRRVVARAPHQATGVVNYALTVSNWYAGTPYSATASGTALNVSRVASPFGAGWNLGGLEQLVGAGQAQMVWLGGDGSARAYDQVTPTLWRGHNRSRPDSIMYDAGSGQYVRHAPQGVRVRFNAAGQHVSTMDRNGATTTFSYVGGVLDRLTVPSGTTSRYYEFGYANGYLGQVAAHGRYAFVSIIDGRMATVTDPDMQVTVFPYPNTVTRLIGARSIQGGSYTDFVYSADARIVQANRFVDASGVVPVVTKYRHQESQGLENTGPLAPARLDALHTWIDGPRPGISDTTRIYVNAYGEPDSVREPNGARTRVLARSASFPALPTHIRFENGRAISATYDTRGRITSSTDSARVSGGIYATTTYQWQNTACPDFPTRVTQPEGDYIEFGYTATCNRQWQQDDRGISGRVSFTYLTDGRLQTITPPLSAATSLTYDPQLGNLATQTRAGVTTTWQRDTWGAPTLVTVPVGGSAFRSQHIAYDAVGRDTLTVDSDGFSTIRTRKRYGVAGRLDTLSTSTTPDPNGIGTITHRYTYDRMDRMTQDRIAGSGGQLITWVYDEAGNVTGGGRRPANRTYDVNNRMVTEGSATFRYDTVGNMTRAENAAARVWLTYNLAGDVVADSQWIAQFNTTSRQPNGFVAGSHVYVLTHRYDLNGRLRRQHHSANLAPAAGQDSITWTFGAGGLLTGLRDVAGNLYQFAYDNEARPIFVNRQLTVGGWVRDSLSYDTRSRVSRRVLRSSASGTPLLLEQPTYDDLDRMTADVAKGENYNYLAIGPLYEVSAGSYESFEVDPLARRSSSNSKIGQHPAITNYFYNPGVGTLSRTEHPGTKITPDTTWYLFNQYGQRQYDEYRINQKNGQFGADSVLVLRNEYVYNTNFELVQTVYRADSVFNGGSPYHFYQPYRSDEGYWYDALGRRVVTWAWKQANCPNKDAKSGCRSTVTRTVWAGDQLAYEIRARWSDPNSDGFADAHHGRVGYLHAGTIDRPIALWKGTQLVHPHLNSRGVFPFGTCGTAVCSTSAVEFIGNRLSAFGADRNPPPFGPTT